MRDCGIELPTGTLADFHSLTIPGLPGIWSCLLYPVEWFGSAQV